MANIAREPVLHRLIRRRRSPYSLYLDEDRSDGLALGIPKGTPFGEADVHRLIRRRRSFYIDEDASNSLALGIPKGTPFPPIGEDPYYALRHYRVWGWRPYEPDWTSSLDVGLPHPLDIPRIPFDHERRWSRRPIPEPLI